MTTIADLTGTYALDPSHSRLGFVTRHAMITKVRGSFDTFEGSGTIDGTDVAKSGVAVTIQSTSINTNNADRDNHLRSGDFFGAGDFPTITFTSTGFAQTDELTLEVTGDLTIKGVTKSVTVPFEFTGAATDPFGNQRVGFEGSTVISRADWGITWNAALEAGGVLVSDKITLEIEVSAIKQA
ncbi:YceI family protein [Propionicicella superfundia]|uniref:YceI family protein n=1 Tax=Propionicicella superfundia TaxID=348582 RepID=UPI0003F84C6C|nr:YceI family protein [Propionicicella superfundia]